MLSILLLAITVAYFPVMAGGLWFTRRRPDLSARFWVVALAAALVLAGVNAATDGPWWLVVLWLLNAALDAVNVYLARRNQRDREISEMWARRFQSQP